MKQKILNVVVVLKLDSGRSFPIAPRCHVLSGLNGPRYHYSLRGVAVIFSILPRREERLARAQRLSRTDSLDPLHISALTMSLLPLVSVLFSQ